MKTKKLLILVLFFCGLFFQGIAQESKIKEKKISKLGNSTFIRFENDNSYQTNQIPTFFKEELAVKASDELREMNSKKDELSFTHYTYQQYYNNIKVEHGIYKVHARDNYLTSANGEFFDVQIAGTTASISAKNAFERLLSQINATTYAWESETNALRGDYQKPEGELVILPVKNNDRTGFDFKLTYKYDIYTLAPFNRAIYFVDANSGNIVAREQVMCTSDADTMYSGQRDIETESTADGFRLLDDTRGGGIYTRNNESALSTNLGGAIDFLDADDDWTVAEWNNADQDQAALDAHWGLEMTYDYFSNVHGRDSFDDSGTRINAFVHVLFPITDIFGNVVGSDPNNAAWTGTNIVFGDGDGTQFTPLTALDVSAHEMAHAVDQFSSDLIYQDESGALDEGLADIWGACVENMAAPEKNRWFIGEDVRLTAYALRDMSDPNNLNLPDTYEGTFWATGAGDFGGVHTNSSVLNHWFFLLVEGSASTDEVNDNGDAFSVNGIGIADAERIAFRMETVYLTASSNYAAAREGAINAAIDLFGDCSVQRIATQNAFYAVGVGDEFEENIAFHFEDSQGNIKDTFCVGQDVILNANATVQGSQNAYFMDIWRVNTDGSVTWLASQGSSNVAWPGWFDGTPTEINISDLYENDPDGSLVFQEGVTYRVKLAINSDDCGWLPLERDFTIGDDIDFHFQDDQGNRQDEFCIGEDVFLDGRENMDTGSYFIDLWRVNADGSQSWLSAQTSTGWDTGTPDNVNITELFETDLEHPIVFQEDVIYSVKLALNIPDCGWTSIQHEFVYRGKGDIDFLFQDAQGNPKTEFCDDEDVFLNGSDNVDTGSYFIDLWRVNADGSQSWLSAQTSNGWDTGTPDNVNITQLFATDLEHPIVFQQGVTYSVKLALSIEPCGWTSIQHEFTIVNCLIGGGDPCDKLIENVVYTRSGISWEAIRGAVGYEVVAICNERSKTCDCSTQKEDIASSTIVRTNSYQIPASLQNGCYTWKIRVLCDDKVGASTYPNPTTGAADVKMSESFAKLNVKLYRMDGFQIIEREYQNTDNFKIDLLRYPSGVYFMHIQTERGLIIQKIIKE
ncbi:M4 family metallopeptidase [Kordia jejudonensis]|uniref:M4 family metallopeptidase n=1 Tax=Kordia jejudonensis TaxID=1348245 RepID=UPI00069C78FC|nr:M4 family metallopeptidase [Kordia jejudonensis]